jgi:hypothetical protein
MQAELYCCRGDVAITSRGYVVIVITLRGNRGPGGFHDGCAWWPLSHLSQKERGPVEAPLLPGLEERLS